MARGFVTYTEKGDDLDTLMRSAGKIAAPFELKIVDGDRRELERGQIGEIAVRGPFMFREYLNKPDETAGVLDRNGWYYTNDLAYTDERGYIYITGRKSEMFKSGGENIVGWAHVMPKPGQTVTDLELESLCREKLANYKKILRASNASAARQRKGKQGRTEKGNRRNLAEDDLVEGVRRRWSTTEMKVLVHPWDG